MNNANTAILNKDEVQYQISKRTAIDTRLTDAWIKDNKLNPHTFATSKLTVLRATMLANELLSEYSDILQARQSQLLKDFQRRAGTAQGMKKITDAQCYDIMNISYKLKRSIMVKQKRKLRLTHLTQT